MLLHHWLMNASLWMFSTMLDLPERFSSVSDLIYKQDKILSRCERVVFCTLCFKKPLICGHKYPCKIFLFFSPTLSSFFFYFHCTGVQPKPAKLNILNTKFLNSLSYYQLYQICFPITDLITQNPWGMELKYPTVFPCPVTRKNSSRCNL